MEEKIDKCCPGILSFTLLLPLWIVWMIVALLIIVPILHFTRSCTVSTFLSLLIIKVMYLK